MKKIIINILGTILIFLTLVAGSVIFLKMSFLKSLVLFILPFLVNIYIIRSIGFLTRINPLDKGLLKIIITHIIAFFVFMVFQYLLINLGIDLFESIFDEKIKNFNGLLIYTGLLSVVSFVIAVLINYLIINIKDNFEKEKKNIRNELLIKRNELNILKGVIQPHFLFNAFNTLTSLIETKNEKAGDFCRGLSEYLRYSLKFKEKELVSVGDELENLSNYLTIEKIRMGDRLTVNFSIDDEAKNKLIPSFSIITFVENAIKHGVSNYLEGGKIEIAAKIKENDLIITVINLVKPKNSLKSNGEGLGIPNLKKRLFILFKNRAVINLFEREDKYYSEMIIRGRET